MKALQIAIKAYYKKQNNSHPSCFDTKKEYMQWIQLEADAPTEPRKFPCRDCTSCYQKEMISAGRCYISEVDVSKISS